MIEVDWSTAPEGATHHHLDERTWWMAEADISSHEDNGVLIKTLHANWFRWSDGRWWGQSEPNPNKIVARHEHAKGKSKSDGSSADYYKLPEGAAELQDLISYRDMNAQMGEIFRAAYRYGLASHSNKMRDAKKIKFYIEAEIKRLEALGE